MRPYRYHRQALAATLFAGAAAALLGCQQPVSLSPTDAPPAEATPAEAPPPADPAKPGALSLSFR